MKNLLLLLIIISSLSFAQSLPRIENDTLYTTSGYKLYPKLEVKIGVGTMPDGDFKYIRTNSASLFNYTSTTGYQGLANQANSLPRNNSGFKYVIKKVEERGSKKRGFNYYVVLKNIIAYEVDVENAIRTGELELPEEFRKTIPTNDTVKMSTTDKYDKLKKLKELLDSGILTQEEFKTEKDKVMAEN
ncbi:SHOCT domain-containing protein [Epilithonimonas ginsengisoli]|uniref:SHOCT domain-containing protein n=1 Tax=Epilithonimonas ginsengisoli TaxID=1245592 RepID=A0ABU4JIR1_9FLAO|nr:MULTISPECIES: SHOCT domain-containing protein [Chryseobacterium group]MBV6879122.1 SHOCT domain-containing protein [Epilithonimonas sp. FP105]MDW8549555.1 SHOCT domain-containing protein [Epilithonimonas ginsengisoli]OAH74417.1 hypothetical protein AXA65_06570 [Chryseobacterium sp. FP211-J200]